MHRLTIILGLGLLAALLVASYLSHEMEQWRGEAENHNRLLCEPFDK